MVRNRTAASPASPPKAALLLLAVLFVASQLPMLTLGYGADPDSWRVASAAHDLWTTGTYAVSRPPGYPLHELVSAPLVGLGRAPLSNGVTVLAALAALAVFYGIVRERTQHPVLLTAGLAFTPLFWINSAATIDYVWSLLFLLLALQWVLQGRVVPAAIALGLAAGFRPMNLIGLVPLAAVIWFRWENPHRLRDAVRFTVLAFISAGICFVGVFRIYGGTEWISMILNQGSRVSTGAGETLALFVYRSVYAVGPVAVLTVVVVLALGRRRLLRLIREREPLALASGIAILVFGLFFLTFPYEKSYILPALPFLLFLVERIASGRVLALFVGALLLFALVNPDVVVHDGARGSPGFNIRVGMAVEELQKRQSLIRWRESTAGYAFPPRSIVMTGTGPAFWFENDRVERSAMAMFIGGDDEVVRQKAGESVYFTPLLSREAVLGARGSGYQVLCVREYQGYIERVTGYTMKDLEITVQ